MTSLHALKNSKEHNLETYINRELSLLEFHKRVLAQAKDTEHLKCKVNRIFKYDIILVIYF